MYQEKVKFPEPGIYKHTFFRENVSNSEWWLYYCNDRNQSGKPKVLNRNYNHIIIITETSEDNDNNNNHDKKMTCDYDDGVIRDEMGW